MLGSSSSTSFDVNCFSFNNEETGSGYYALIGPDGCATNNYLKFGPQQIQFISPKNQDISGLLRQGSRFFLLENSVEQFHDIDEESLQDESSVEELKVDDNSAQNTARSQSGVQISRMNKKQKQTRNHILVFKNPMELLDS